MGARYTCLSGFTEIRDDHVSPVALEIAVHDVESTRLSVSLHRMGACSLTGMVHGSIIPAPGELLGEDLGPEEFIDALEEHDQAMATRLDDMKSAGQILRYMARIDPSAAPGSDRPVVTVGPVGVPPDHPSSLLGGTEAFVAFTTERYQDTPLIMQGAGGPVTAVGVLSDILKISMTLRGR